MLDLTFGEQVKIILSRKGMTIKELAETIELQTGKKMSRQNLTQRLGRDNFQEQDMRMIAEILGCPFHLNILDENIQENISSENASIENNSKENNSRENSSIEETLIKTKKQTAEGKVTIEVQEGKRNVNPIPLERDITIGELVDMHEELDEILQESEKAPKEESEANQKALAEESVKPEEPEVGTLEEYVEEPKAEPFEEFAEEPEAERFEEPAEEPEVESAEEAAEAWEEEPEAYREELYEEPVGQPEAESFEEFAEEAEAEAFEEFAEEPETFREEQTADQQEESIVYREEPEGAEEPAETETPAEEQAAEPEKKAHGWMSYLKRRRKKRDKEEKPEKVEPVQEDLQESEEAEEPVSVQEISAEYEDFQNGIGVEEYEQEEPVQEEYEQEEYMQEEYAQEEYEQEEYKDHFAAEYEEAVEEALAAEEEEDLEKGDVNPYTGREYQSNSVRMHPTRIGYVQVYDRGEHKWTDMTEWAFLGYQERKKALLGKDYEPPIYLD